MEVRLRNKEFGFINFIRTYQSFFRNTLDLEYPRATLYGGSLSQGPWHFEKGSTMYSRFNGSFTERTSGITSLPLQRGSLQTFREPIVPGTLRQ